MVSGVGAAAPGAAAKQKGRHRSRVPPSRGLRLSVRSAHGHGVRTTTTSSFRVRGKAGTATIEVTSDMRIELLADEEIVRGSSVGTKWKMRKSFVGLSAVGYRSNSGSAEGCRLSVWLMAVCCGPAVCCESRAAAESEKPDR